MEQSVKNIPLMTDLRTMEWLFYVPIILYILLGGCILLGQANIIEMMLPVEIKNVLGTLCVPGISLWVIGLYKSIINEETKEVLLSLPYSPAQLGIFRVCRIMVLYIGMFYCIFILLVNYDRDLSITAETLYFPLVGMVFFASISFVAILGIKNEIFTYVVIGIIATYEYVTRGGQTGWFYPFQWILKRPYYSKVHIIILLISSGFLFMIGQWMVTKREYLMK